MKDKPTYEELERRIEALEQEALARRRTEEALRENERLLHDMGRMARIGGWEVDTRTFDVTWTEETYRIHEVPVGKMPSLEEAILFFHPDDRDRLKEAIERALEHGEPYDMELRFTTARGRPLWTHTICKPMVVDGKTVKLTGTFQDITELKQAQEELDRIFSLSIDLICIADIHTATFLRINPAFTHTLGYFEKELLGRPFLDFIHPDDIEATIEVIEKGLKKGTMVVNFENRYRCRDGSYRWLNWVSHPQPDEGITYAMGRDITDQKQAEKALRESEERYEDIVGSIPGAVYQFMPAEDGAYRFLYLSKGAEDIFERPLSDFTASNIPLDGVYPDDLEPLTTSIAKTVRGQKSWAHEFRVLTPSGAVKWISMKANPRMRADGTCLWSGVILDVTRRIEAQQALKESEERFSAMFEHMGSGVAVYEAVDEGSDFVFKAFNPEAEHITRISRNEALGHRLLELFPHMDKAGLLGALQRVWKTGKAEHLPPFYYQDEKREGWRENRLYKLPSGEVVALFDDVTERMRTQEELRRSHERFLTVLDGIDAAIYVADMETYEILFMNRYMKEEFGADLTGDICWKVLRHKSGPCDHCTNENLLTDNGPPGEAYVWEDKNPVTGRWYLNYDRSIKWVDERLVRLQVATDITDLKRMEAERLEYEARFQQMQKMEAIGTLAGGIAHDFNNILGVILGNTELAMMDLPEPHPARESLTEIRQAGFRARDLVKQILLIARRQEHRLAVIRVEPIFKESLKMLRSTIPSTVEIRQSMQDPLPTLYADPTQIQQIIMNLCTNAAQAMEVEGGIIEVTLDSINVAAGTAITTGALTEGTYIRIDVNDTGPGILPKDLDRIFEPYFTTKEVGMGTGLGLAVVHGIVKERGGGIAVESKTGGGARFTVYLPASWIESGQEDSLENVNGLIRGMGRILLVDDETAILRLGRKILEHLGYEVETFDSGTDALAAFRDDPDRFDLIITDMTMPHITGDRLAGEIIAVRPDMPVILCTGFSRQISRKKAEKIGIRALLMKPLTASDLAETVQQALRGT